MACSNSSKKRVSLSLVCAFVALLGVSASSSDVRAANSSGTPCNPSNKPWSNGSANDTSMGWATNPCKFTRNTRNLKFAKDYEGGEQFVKYMKGWWKDEFEPALKNMAKEIHTSYINQTRQMGAVLDSENLSDSALIEQSLHRDEKMRVQPMEQSCVAAGNNPGMSKGFRVANGLAKGFRYDAERRSGGGANSTAENGPLEEYAKNYKDFCTYFHDQLENNGMSDCPAADGLLINGDIDIENVLFSDTIDFSKKEKYMAAQAILRNIIEPKTQPKIPDNVVDTGVGHERILKLQQLRAARNIAAEAVASILSRRAAVPSTGVAKQITDIRKKIGIDAARIADGGNDPSYNEIMLTLTKERFFDPNYFVDIGDDIGALKQEQTAINALASIQQGDIYRLQEQINALLAARAGLGYQANEAPNRVDQTPLR